MDEMFQYFHRQIVNGTLDAVKGKFYTNIDDAMFDVVNIISKSIPIAKNLCKNNLKTGEGEK